MVPIKTQPTDWERVFSVIRSIPSGYWRSYGDVCEAAGMKRSAAMAIAGGLSRAQNVPENIYRVLREDGTPPPGWKGEIGSVHDCIAKLKEEGAIYRRAAAADLEKRFNYPKAAE